jgi:hypothetical protein
MTPDGHGNATVKPLSCLTDWSATLSLALQGGKAATNATGPSAAATRSRVLMETLSAPLGA